MKLVSTRWKACAFAALAVAAFSGTTSADAADEITVRPPLLAAPAAPAATAAFLAGIDPSTGMLRPPTPGERLELASFAGQADAGLRRAAAATEVQHADGSVSLAVDPSLFSASTVVVGADGQVHYTCGDAGHLHPTTVTAPAAEDR